MKKILSLALILMLLAAVCASAETFKMGFDAEYPPYTYLGDDGEYTGYDIEMCKKVCEILGWEFEPVPVNWDTKLIQLDAGEVDCIWSGLTIDVISPEEYSLSFAYSNNSQVVLAKKGSGIETIADLEGKIVGVQLGTSADLMLTNDMPELTETFAELTRFENYNVCFTELMAGSIDAVAIDIGVANGKIAEYGEDYYILSEVLAPEQYGICFRLADAEMCAAVEGALMQLVEDGSYVSLAEEFGLDTSALCLSAN